MARVFAITIPRIPNSVHCWKNTIDGFAAGWHGRGARRSSPLFSGVVDQQELWACTANAAAGWLHILSRKRMAAPSMYPACSFTKPHGA
jgi:hypothetical protein